MEMAVPVPNAEYLKALASVCEAAQKLLVPPPPPGHPRPGYVQLPCSASYRSATPSPVPTYHGPTPSFLPYPTTHGVHQGLYPASGTFQSDASELMKENVPAAVAPYFSYQASCPPYRPLSAPGYPDGRHATPVPVRPLTPPLTPEPSHPPANPRAETPPSTTSFNPVLRTPGALAQFHRHLDETWPEECMRRGSAIIRASLYQRIADVLRGGEATTRFKHWVKKTEFFLVEQMQPGVGYGACLAIPVGRPRGGSKKVAAAAAAAGAGGGGGGGGKMVGARGSYKLVARLEDFVHIIGTYHNDQQGHHGIRKTYAMVQENFSYVPRTAVAKFIELCDICSVHRKKVGSSRALQDRGTNTATPAFGGRMRRANELSASCQRVETEIVTTNMSLLHPMIVTPPDSRPGTPRAGRIPAVESVEELGLTIDTGNKSNS